MSTRIPQLYGLRALAIGLVLVTHLWGYPAGYELINRLAAAGWMGVQLSFVLSGFLITKILWRTREDSRYYVNFYARRALRIFPLYYLLLLCVFVLLPLLSKPLPGHLEQTSWMYWAYLSNFALASGGWQLFLTDITWSLAVEEQFYLIWPALVRLMNKRRMIGFCVSLVVLAPLARTLMWDGENWMWIHMLMPFRADAFALGALLALLPESTKRTLAPPTFVLGGALLIMLVISGYLPRTSMLAGTVGYTMVALVASSAVALAAHVKALAWKPLVHMGTVSYGIYIFHPLCLMVTSTLLAFVGLDQPGFTGDAIRLIATSAAAVAVGTVSYRLIEAPLLSLKRYFSSSAPREAGTGTEVREA